MVFLDNTNYDQWLIRAGKLQEGQTLCFLAQQIGRDEITAALDTQYPDKGLFVSHVHGARIYVKRPQSSENRDKDDG